MNVIDHRILIPTSPENVWNYLSNINNLPEWQVNVTQVSLLTSPTQVPGPGTRWRTAMTNNREFVVMVTAWYDRIGYEYTIVDGVSFKSNKGQIRLQEIAEGTIVQWTFQFETTGLFGTLRNGMGSKRSIEQDMIDSLRTLWKVIEHKRSKKESFEARSLMRDAPDVEARANYRARYPTVLENQNDVEPEANPNIEDDTRPRGIDTQPAASQEAELARFAPPKSLEYVEEEFSEPDFVKQGYDEPDFNEPEISQKEIYTQASTDQTPAEAISSEEFYGQKDTEFEDELPSVEPEQSSTVSQPIAEELPRSSELTNETKLTSDYSQGKIDTARISVFELFGLQKPSETQEIKAVSVEEAPALETEGKEQGISRRYGLRVKLRRNAVKLRRPY